MPIRFMFCFARRLRNAACAGAIIFALIGPFFPQTARSQATPRETKDAVDLLTKIIESKASTADEVADALVARAAAYSQLGEMDKSIADATAALALAKLSPQNHSFMLDVRASSYFQKSEYEKAIADYTQELAGRTDGKEIPLTGRAACYVQLGKMDQAIADYDAMVALPGAKPTGVATSLVAKGDCEERLAHHQQAMADYMRAIEVPNVDPPTLAYALLQRASAYVNAGENDPGLRDVSKAIGLDGVNLAFALTTRARIYMLVGDDEKSVADATRAIGLADISAEDLSAALSDRATVRMDAGDYQKALEDADKASTLKDVSPFNQGVAMTCRGNCLRRLRRMDQAIATFSEIMAVKDMQATMVAEAQWTRGLCYLEGGDSKRSADDFAAAVAICSKVIDAPDTLPDTLGDALVDRGFAEYLAGDFDQALQDSRRDLAVFPANANVMYNIGTIQVRQGNFAAARKTYEAAMALRSPLGVNGAESDLIEQRDLLHGPAEIAVFLGWFRLHANHAKSAKPELIAYLKDHENGPLSPWARELLKAAEEAGK